MSGKVRSLYFQRKKAANLAWTTTYRRAHKKDQTGEQAKRKRRNLHSKKPRAVAGVSLEVRLPASVASCPWGVRMCLTSWQNSPQLLLLDAPSLCRGCHNRNRIISTFTTHLCILLSRFLSTSVEEATACTGTSRSFRIIAAVLILTLENVSGHLAGFLAILACSACCACTSLFQDLPCVQIGYSLFCQLCSSPVKNEDVL